MGEGGDVESRGGGGGGGDERLGECTGNLATHNK